MSLTFLDVSIDVAVEDAGTTYPPIPMASCRSDLRAARNGMIQKMDDLNVLIGLDDVKNLTHIVIGYWVRLNRLMRRTVWTNWLCRTPNANLSPSPLVR